MTIFQLLGETKKAWYRLAYSVMALVNLQPKHNGNCLPLMAAQSRG